MINMLLYTKNNNEEYKELKNVSYKLKKYDEEIYKLEENQFKSIEELKNKNYNKDKYNKELYKIIDESYDNIVKLRNREEYINTCKKYRELATKKIYTLGDNNLDSIKNAYSKFLENISITLVNLINKFDKNNNDIEKYQIEKYQNLLNIINEQQKKEYKSIVIINKDYYIICENYFNLNTTYDVKEILTTTKINPIELYNFIKKFDNLCNEFVSVIINTD